ncbi:MAG TPA: hypothetical protein EYG03_10070 [Planctomycetes bacterium]|nr:hypothetical protein [Planctomycetota bacterium]
MFCRKRRVFQHVPVAMSLRKTGTRRSNVLEMEWKAISIHSCRWEIPETKNGDFVIVHLPPEAVAILEASRECQKDSIGRYVFPSFGVIRHHNG